MTIAKKSAPRVQDADMKRVIDQVYADLNALIASVNQVATEASPNASGIEGSFRVVFDRTDKKYYLEAKHQTGWVRVEATLSSPL